MDFDEEIITELDIMPMSWRNGRYAPRRGVPAGYAHRPDEPCPYQGRGFARNPSLHCCWLRGEKVYYELKKLDLFFDGMLADELASDMDTGKDALAFARKLRKLADEYEEAHGEDRMPGIGWVVKETDASGMFVSETRYSTFEEVLATLRKTADWFEITGRLEFGVRVWG